MDYGGVRQMSKKSILDAILWRGLEAEQTLEDYIIDQGEVLRRIVSEQVLPLIKFPSPNLILEAHSFQEKMGGEESFDKIIFGLCKFGKSSPKKLLLYRRYDRVRSLLQAFGIIKCGDDTFSAIKFRSKAWEGELLLDEEHRIWSTIFGQAEKPPVYEHFQSGKPTDLYYFFYSFAKTGPTFSGCGNVEIQLDYALHVNPIQVERDLKVLTE